MANPLQHQQQHQQHQSSQSLPEQTTTVARELADLLRLRFEHGKLELAEFLDKWVNRFVRNTVAAGTAGIGALFMLIAAALAIGDALGHLAWGMLIIGGGLTVVGGLFALMRPKLVDVGDKKATVNTKVLEPSPPRGRPVIEHS
jgi:hypothetical protein